MDHIIVTAPATDFTGTIAGLEFVGGRAITETTSPSLPYFQRLGYSIATPESTPVAEATEPTPVVVDQPADDVPIQGAPARNASRNTWVDYAEALGLDCEGLRRDIIIERVIKLMNAT